MTKSLLTKREVAELAGVSERTIERRGIDSYEGRTLRNGRAEPMFDVKDLPAEVQQKWAASDRRKVIEIAPAADGAQLALTLTVPTGPNLSEEDRAEASARFALIEPLVDRDKYALLWAQYPRVGDFMAYWAKLREVPERTIYRYLSAWKKGGLPALVRRDRSDKGLPKLLNDAARDLLIALATGRRAYADARVTEMWRVYEEERVWRAAHAAKKLGEFELGKYARYVDEDGLLRPAAQLPEISYETFRTWYNRIPEMLRDMARRGEEAYRNTHDILSHRDIAAVQPMEYVVMDHRVLDLFCLARADGGWRLVRPWLTAAIDMRTRKWLGWAIVETPSSQSIATVLKRVFIDYGVPVHLYWDNGKDFTCEWFEGSRQTRKEPRVGEMDETWRGVLGTVGCRVIHAIVHNPRAKLIEPNFGRISNFDRTLPEWCGHQPGARPERLADMIREHEQWVKGERAATPFKTIEEIATLYSRVMRSLNEQPLQGDGMRTATPTGMGWMAPNQCWDVLIKHVPRRSVPADVLQMCFAKRKELTVHNGEVSTTLAGRLFHYRMADNSVRLMQLDGKKVELAYDPLDMGEAALYYERGFFGLVRCVELRRMGEEAFVQDERDRRGARREIKRAIAAAHRLAPVASPEERLQRRAEVMPRRDEVARVELPAEIAAPVAAAGEAARAEREVLDGAPVALEVEERPVQDKGDDEFQFFS